MELFFFKYHGAGNDFILIDNRTQNIHLSEQQIAQLCHRRFGIGADGLMFLESDKSSDFKMKYYNSDGKEGSMCGNGGRCIVAFAHEIGIRKEHYHFMASDGLHEAVLDKTEVNLKMIDVTDIQKLDSDWFLNTGSPHAIEIVDNINSINVEKQGEKLRHDPRFGEKGTNVNFIEVHQNHLKIRTYERGVEAETLACGTGAVASAIIANQLYPQYKKFNLKALGGNLEVSFEKTDSAYSNIWLKGPAVKVFEGRINI